MLTLWKRKPDPLPVEAIPAQPVPQGVPVRRNRQQNIKVTDDCAAAFAAIANALHMSKAALFEDLVAERLETLQRQGVKVEV